MTDTHPLAEPIERAVNAWILGADARKRCKADILAEIEAEWPGLKTERRDFSHYGTRRARLASDWRAES